MSRTKQDIERMTGEDQAVGIGSHYWPLSNFLNERNYKRGIEIGTAYGGSANHILTHCDLELLICIDPYKFYPDMPGLFDQEDYDMVKESAYKRLSVHSAYKPFYFDSKGAYAILKHSDLINDGENKFDFIFIDGWHEKNTVKWECEHYSKLLRKGGCLMGHDYGNMEQVDLAVNEFAKETGRELHLLPGHIWYFNY